MLFTLGILVSVKFETLFSNSRLLNINSMLGKVFWEKKEKGKKKEKINVTSDANELSSQSGR